MRGISISELGTIDVMKLVTNLPKPTPTGKQVLINVKYAGVNPVDTYIRSGAFGKATPEFPFTPGYDGSGIVHEIGDQVTQIKEGDRVWFAKCLTGSSAEYCLCNEEAVGGLPEPSTFEVGAMIGTPYMTAYRAIFQKAHVKKGETVLIHGATGGVGNACVQMCKNIGCRVIGTAGSTEGADMLFKLGADAVFNHRTDGYIDKIAKSGEKINVIIEMLANVNLQSDLELIEPNGRIAIVGNRGNVEINPRLMMKNEITVTGVMAGAISLEESLQCKEYIKEGLQAGWIKPVLWKAFELQQIGQAHEEIITNKGAKGQMVLKI